MSDDGDDLSDYESVLKSIDIKLRDSQGEFRSFEDILDDVAKRWNTLSSVQQAAALKVMSGTRQQNRMTALLEGYNKTLELTEVAANSAGTAVEKFNKSYKESLEAKTNTLQASFESMIMNSDMSEVYGGILDATTALVNLINKTNALKGAMGALAVTGVTKAFLSIKTGAYEAYVNLNKFKSAIDIVNATSISSKSFDKLLLLSNGLSKSQLQLMLSTDALTISQKKQVLVTAGLSEEQALAQLQSWKMVAANTGLKNEADIIKEIQSELEETGNIGVDSMKKITKQYPEANKALSDYMQGIISEQELFSQLETIYENDKNQYIQSVVDKSQTDEEFFNAVMTNYPELYNELQTLYGNDVDNWSNMEKAKLEITNKAIKELAGVWSDYFKVVSDANGKLAVQTTGWYDAGMYSADPDEVEAMDEEYNNMYNHFQSVVDGANAAIDALDNYSFKQVSSSINLDWKGLGKDSSSSSSGSDSSSSSEPSPQDFNWVEPLLSKISKAYDRLKNKVADTTRTWLNRNNALSDSMETLLSEINAQSDAYDFYMDRFNSYDLSDYYKDQIANGSFNIETIYDDDLKDAISDCQDLYDKAQDAADSVQSLNIELRQLAKSRFDNIQSQFEEVLGKVNSIKDLYSKDNDLLEEQGWFASTLLNSSMIEQEQKNLAKLEQERDALTKALNSAMESGKIEAESEDWYSMQSAIDDCTSSIYDAKKALVEYDNAIRQINWDAFDRTRNDVSNLIDETQFLVDLLKDEDITDDNGNMNDNGKAAQALIAQKYQLYLNQAKAYKDEILKINEELVNDPYDKELLDRKQELIKAQQDAINSSISEKDALKDLVQEGYDTFLDKLDEVIQKYKDLMSQQKDAYDYEKSIAEKTKALNALEKQYSAVQGDNSEEGKKNIQQLKDQINTAKDDLKDTEYEKLLSDTQAILDELADDAKNWLDQRIDEFDVTMQEIIDQSNENATNISQTITDTAESYGYKLSESMASIWSTNASNITNGINSVLADFSNKFVEGNNAINKVCGDINAAVQGLLANSNAEAQRVADEIAKQQAEQNANTDGGYSDGGGSSGSGDDWSDNWDNSDSGSSDDGGVSWGDWFYHLEDDYPKDLLEVD